MLNSETETRVLDLWDNGLLEPKIARVTNVPEERVRRIVSGYVEGCSATHRALMTKGSTRLRSAILAHFKPMPSTGRSLIWNTRSPAEVASQQGSMA